MLANANPREAAPASRSVREFIAVCARHNIPYGDLNCLPTLLRELNADKHFAMHFWSVVAKQSATGESVVESIVEAVTGRTPAEVREAGPAHRILMDRLEKLIAGQDVDPEQPAEAEPSPQTVRHRDAADSESPAAEAASTAAEDVLPIRRVADTRRRRRNHGAVRPASVPEQAATREETMRLVLMPEPVPHEAANALTDEPLLRRHVPSQSNASTAPPIPVPLSSYTEEVPRGSAPARLLIGAVVLAVVAAGSYVFVRDGGSAVIGRLGGSMRAGYDTAVATWNGEPLQSPAAAAPAPTPSPINPPVQTTPPATMAAPPAGQPAAQPQTSRDRSAQPGLTPAQTMAATAAYNQQRDVTNSAEPIPPSGGIVQVPENVMDAHLIASRVPVLPDAARDAGVTGVVRMQALINRSGYVSRLHVLEGATELRRAALQAVSAWRFRPYLVNGQPVDVMTTITVDFSSLE